MPPVFEVVILTQLLLMMASVFVPWRKPMSQSRFLNLTFAFLFIVGITLVAGFPKIVEGCGGDRPCFFDFRCVSTQGKCIATEFSCGETALRAQTESAPAIFTRVIVPKHL